MGDLNTKSTMTGDKQIDDHTNKMCEHQLNKLIDKANLKQAKNKTIITNNEHWTYKGPVGGLSVPDYILYSKEIRQSVRNYRLSWEANCDSYHAMQIITIQMIKPIGPSLWKQETINRTSWHDKNITEYKTTIATIRNGNNTHNTRTQQKIATIHQ